MAKRRVGNCVYCGQWCKLTDDHIPPKSLFDKPRPADLIKVPSCPRCNGGASRDDEYFKTVMVLKDKAADHPEAVGIRASVFRALQKPEKLAFARAVVRTTRQVRVQTKAGIRPSRRAVFDVDLGRLDRVVARITQGLFWHHQRLRIPDGFEVAVYSEDGLRGLDAPMIEQFQSNVVIPALNNPLNSIGRGVMRYRYAFASDRPHVSAWIYEFYEDVRFAALVMPAGAGRTSSEEPVH